MHSPVAGNHFICAFIVRTHQHRHQDAVVHYALHQIRHLLIVYHLEGMVLEGKDLVNTDLRGHILADRRSQQLLHRCKMYFFPLNSHDEAPPVSVPGMLMQPFP